MSQEQRNAAHFQIFEEPEKKTYKSVADTYHFFFNKAGIGSEYPKNKIGDFYDHILDFVLCEETIAIC